MSDLIDRQAAIDAVKAYLSDCQIEDADWHGNGIEYELESLPSAQPNLQPTCNQLATDCISRRAAIKAIEDLPNCYNGFSDTYDKSCIIGVLEELPSAQPERRFDEWCTDCKEYDQEKHCCPRWNRVIRTTLQDAQRTGRWKVSDLPKGKMKYCSECGFGQYIADERRYSFCPNCGARMEVEHETD